MSNNAKDGLPVSPNNPCPFLRGLVSEGKLADDVAPLSRVANAVVEQAQKGQGAPDLSSKLIYAVALVANGISPWDLLKTKRKGLRLNELRGGPLDKKGAGSGVLDQHGHVSEQELERLSGFASEKRTNEGSTELGLDAKEIDIFMDANFERAAGHRRRIDRKLMDGEWPVLLKVMGKGGPDGRYLSVDDVRLLVVERKFPAHMTE